MADPKQRAAAIAVSLALLTTGEHAIAQSSASELETRLEAGAATAMRAGALPLHALALTPSIRYADRRFSFRARGTAQISEQRWNLGAADASLEAVTPLLHGFRAEVSANADRAFHSPALVNDQVDASGRLHYMAQRGGVWLGSGVARPLRAVTVSNVNVSSGGVWTKLGPTTIRGSVTSFFFTKVSIDSQVADANTQSASSSACETSSIESMEPVVGDALTRSIGGTGCRRQSRVTDFEGSIQYQARRLELTVRGGRRMGDSFDVTPDSRQWASAQAAVWITNKLAAVAGGGREPGQPTRGLPARSFGSLGLMLAYWPIPRGAVLVETPASLVHAFELRPAGPTVQRVTARIGGVETVEIMGDFSDWTPLPMVRRGRDQWELLVPMKTGVRQINMRIDGGTWIAPPGMPTMKDDFGGQVGVIVVKPQS
jgi:hypothetical protein